MLGVLFDGIAYGSLLFLVSLGLSVTMGLMNFVNLAHGAFAMAGGYVCVIAMTRLEQIVETDDEHKPAHVLIRLQRRHDQEPAADSKKSGHQPDREANTQQQRQQALHVVAPELDVRIAACPAGP